MMCIHMIDYYSKWVNIVYGLGALVIGAVTIALLYKTYSSQKKQLSETQESLKRQRFCSNC